MRVARLGELPQSVKTVDTFYGYNHNPRIGSGEFFEEENLSSDCFPVLSVRGKRYRYGSDTGITGLVWLDGLWYAKPPYIVHAESGEKYNLMLGGGEKDLLTFGSYIIILPDKRYINTKDPNDRGSIEKSVKFLSVINSLKVELFIVDEDGNNYPYAIVSQTQPESGQWLNPEDHVLREVTDGGYKELKYYLKLYFPAALKAQSLGGKISAGDCVKISASGDGWDADDLNGLLEKYVTIKETDGCFSFIVEQPVGFVTRTLTCEFIEFASKMPNMDFVFEHANRLWGCRYGEDLNGKFVNEIYASELGNFKNWHSFQGLSSDSYTMSCGTDGQWTGAMEVGGYPTFWKERYLYKIYGDYPAQYSCTPMECSGVAKNAAGSMAVLDGVLYYNSTFGIFRYDGSVPTDISSVFGGESFSGGVAGILRKKYYISFQGATFVYDTVKKLWHRESPVNALRFSSGGGTLYYIDGGILYHIAGGVDGDTEAENSVAWKAVTGVLGEETYQHKRLQRIDLRMTLPPGSRLRIRVEYDSSGIWEPIAGQMTGKALRSFTIPLRPKRCDHLRLKLEGSGDAKLYSITYITEKGSDHA